MSERPHYDLSTLADSARIYHSARRDRCATIRALIADNKSRFTLEQVARVEATLGPAERIADALRVMAERRADLPPWLLTLLEDGAT